VNDDTSIATAAGQRQLRYTHLIYALHSLAVLIGVLGASSIAGRFVFGLPSIIAVIINYALRRELTSPLLVSHFRWQIRTFWFALLWLAVVLVVSMPFVLIAIGGMMAATGFAVIGLWICYRVIRGWLALHDGRSMPMPVAT